MKRDSCYGRELTARDFETAEEVLLFVIEWMRKHEPKATRTIQTLEDARGYLNPEDYE